jgi:hypothetical protein
MAAFTAVPVALSGLKEPPRPPLSPNNPKFSKRAGLEAAVRFPFVANRVVKPATDPTAELTDAAY